jgi:hypothetical protein
MRGVVCLVLLCAGALPAFAQDCHRILGQQRADAPSIKQVEHAWTEAYMHGGTEYLECLLAPDYVSVSGTGVPRDKATIVGNAKSNAGKTTPLPDLPEPKIQLYGDTAVVQSSVAAAPDGKYPAMYSSDVFAFHDGAWRAIYSQHTAVEAK